MLPESDEEEEIIWDSDNSEDAERVPRKFTTENFANRAPRRKGRKVRLTTTVPEQGLGSDLMSEEEVIVCRERIYEHHRKLSDDPRYGERFPNAFDVHSVDDLMKTKIGRVTCVLEKGKRSNVTPKNIKNTIAHMMAELQLLRDPTASIPAASIMQAGKMLMAEEGIVVDADTLTCSRVTLHWIRLLGTAKYFNVHNRDQVPAGTSQLAQRKWPLHPFFMWLYATRPLFNDPTKYAFSPEYGLYDAVQLHTFVVIMASLCNVNEWYIDVDQMENALWKPHEKEGFDLYNQLHRFVDMFYHNNEVMVDAVVNHGMAAIVGRFLTMRAARYMRASFYRLIREWYHYYIRTGSYSAFIRQHRWVLLHFVPSLEECAHLLSPINAEYVDLTVLISFVAQRHARAFEKLRAKDPSYPEAGGHASLFAARFYKMVMDMFRLNPRFALMGASCLSHDVAYLRDRKISVVIPSDFYVDRNFERYDLLGRRWVEDPDGPAPSSEEFQQMRAAITDPSLVEIVVPPNQNDDKEEEEEAQDLEISRYLKRLEKEKRMAAEHPDVLDFMGKPVFQQHAPLSEDDGLLRRGYPEELVIESILFEFQDQPDTKLTAEQAATVYRNLETCMLAYLKMIMGTVQNLKVYRNEELPQEYHDMYLKKFAVHQKQYREPDDPDAIVFLDMSDMELVYNAMLSTPRKRFIRYLPGDEEVAVLVRLPDEELDDDETCLDDDEERYQRALPNANMRHAFFRAYTISLPRKWRRPLLRTMRAIMPAIAGQCYHRIDRDLEGVTPFSDYTGRTEFLRRLVNQHKPDHEHSDPEDYELRVASRPKRKWSENTHDYAFQGDRRCDMVGAADYRLAVEKDAGHVADFRFNPRFSRLAGLSVLVALLEHEGAVRKLVTPAQVHVIPFVDLEDPANPSPCIDTVPYLTLPRVNLPIYVRWKKELNARYDLDPPTDVVGFYQSFYVLRGSGAFSTSGIFHMPPIPLDDTSELAEDDNK